MKLPTGNLTGISMDGFYLRLRYSFSDTNVYRTDILY